MWQGGSLSAETVVVNIILEKTFPPRDWQLREQTTAAFILKGNASVLYNSLKRMCRLLEVKV